MRREILHLMLSWPLVTALVGGAAAQDGPLLPGLDNSAPIEDAAAPALETETPMGPVIVPYGDDIRPLDANGIPQSGPPFGGELALPDPPAIEPKAEEPHKRNWLQKSTEAIRGLSKPDSKEPEHAAPEPGLEDNKASEKIRNWQMLRRRPASPGQAVPGKRVQPQTTLQPRERATSPQGAMQSKRSIQAQPPLKSQRMVPSPSQMRPPVGVEAKNRANQQPSSRRQVQAAPGNRIPVATSPINATPKAIDPHRTADNGPRSPWERPSTARLRPAAPVIKAAPAQGTRTKPTTLRSALGLDAPPPK